MASYLVRSAISLKRLVYIDGQKAVIYRALKPNPRLGANFVAMDPLEWLARIADHIPDPGRHRTLFYSFYSSRARGARAKEKALLEGVSAEPPKKRRCAPSWARLISKVYHADPLTCRQCGGKLKIVAYIHSQVAINKILDTSASPHPSRSARLPRSATSPSTTRGASWRASPSVRRNARGGLTCGCRRPWRGAGRSAGSPEGHPEPITGMLGHASPRGAPGEPETSPTQADKPAAGQRELPLG